MSKELQCPHFYRLSGVQYGCLLGRFPCNCEECDCEDKQYVEVATTTSTTCK